MKHFILPIALGLALVSCNRDNDNNNGTEETPILPVKIVELGSEDGDLETEFKYNGDKLTEVIYKYTEGSRKSVVAYTGDFITSVINYDNNKKVGETSYKYETGRLVEEIEKEIDSEGKEYSSIATYTYNADGTITEKNDNGKSQYTDIITMTNGNIVKRIEGNGSAITTYSYDTKNNPFKNVKGMSALVLSQEDSGINNILERVIIFDNGNHTDKTRTYTYQYKNDFPTERVFKNNDGDKTYKTIYTYNK